MPWYLWRGFILYDKQIARLHDIVHPVSHTHSCHHYTQPYDMCIPWFQTPCLCIPLLTRMHIPECHLLVRILLGCPLDACILLHHPLPFCAPLHFSFIARFLFEWQFVVCMLHSVNGHSWQVPSLTNHHSLTFSPATTLDGGGGGYFSRSVFPLCSYQLVLFMLSSAPCTYFDVPFTYICHSRP